MDGERWKEMGVDQHFAERRCTSYRCYEKWACRSAAPARPTDHQRPKVGDHIAWPIVGVSFANSALAPARTGEGPEPGRAITARRIRCYGPDRSHPRWSRWRKGISQDVVLCRPQPWAGAGGMHTLLRGSAMMCTASIHWPRPWPHQALSPCSWWKTSRGATPPRGGLRCQDHPDDIEDSSAPATGTQARPQSHRRRIYWRGR
jgi:hypothetical protein